MLEILLLIKFGKSLAKLAKSKGRSGGWAALGVAFWFGGEVMGFIVGTAFGLELGAYLFALAFAGAGIGVAYLVVKSLAPMGPALADESMAG